MVETYTIIYQPTKGRAITEVVEQGTQRARIREITATGGRIISATSLVRTERTCDGRDDNKN